MLELAMGTYPYPPETYSNVFAQLTAIVHGPPPEMPEKYTEIARDFVSLWLVPLYLNVDIIHPLFSAS